MLLTVSHVDVFPRVLTAKYVCNGFLSHDLALVVRLLQDELVRTCPTLEPVGASARMLRPA